MKFSIKKILNGKLLFLCSELNLNLSPFNNLMPVDDLIKFDEFDKISVFNAFDAFNVSMSF